MKQEKLYFFTFKRYDRRCENILGRTVGVVKANSYEEADKKINEIYTDYDGGFEMVEVLQDSDLYLQTIYKL